MTRQVSFTRLEQALAPGFRERMDKAETVEDVRRFFAETVATLIADALGESASVRNEHVVLCPENETGYELHETVKAGEGFAAMWETSDLSRIIGDFARVAGKRATHLARNPERTEARIRHASGR